LSFITQLLLLACGKVKNDLRLRAIIAERVTTELKEKHEAPKHLDIAKENPHEERGGT